MINSKFKTLRTNIKYFTKHENWQDTLIGVTINGKSYSRGKGIYGLTRKQLEYFKYIPDFENKEGISI